MSNFVVDQEGGDDVSRFDCDGFLSFFGGRSQVRRRDNVVDASDGIVGRRWLLRVNVQTGSGESAAEELNNSNRAEELEDNEAGAEELGITAMVRCVCGDNRVTE